MSMSKKKIRTPKSSFDCYKELFNPAEEPLNADGMSDNNSIITCKDNPILIIVP